MARQFGPRERSCEGKVNYHRRRDAKRAARRVRRQTGEHLQVYGCQYCGSWHLGHGHATSGKKRGPRGDDL